MGQWEEPVWKLRTSYVTLWKTVETGRKLAVAKEEEGGVNWGVRDV